ncbi:splicing factor 3B subunit 10-domain-containing protein [Catenaria anguillulae PL171]|uniref:Splicing factor 3B subunit 10-domain-containing protein n=1 Tax=Catenaria anguillulae PL171 TaxID=765915 RepID=A0A1Y2HYB4_9FUNG|nr:splicing factor 3B subunit 10-domain-containing protein [Catenaria anguillulae PL171]
MYFSNASRHFFLTLFDAFVQDRFTLNTQLEHLQSKHVGTGHADTTRYEWLVNQHRDTLALMIGSRHLTAQMALAEGESIARAKYMLKQVCCIG